MRLGDMRGQRRRAHRRLLAKVLKNGVLYTRNWHEFRQVERLHRVGLVTACVSRPVWHVVRRRPFRELAVFAKEADALEHYWKFLPRRGCQ